MHFELAHLCTLFFLLPDEAAKSQAIAGSDGSF